MSFPFALLCGAAGILRGWRATTHCAAFDLLPYYGAIPVKSRVVIDGNYISTAGVTAGLDGSFKVVSILRGDSVAKEIQLDIEYAPEPPFHSGTPDTAHRKQSVHSSKTTDPSKNRAKPKHACSRQNSESRSSPRWIAKAINKSPVVGRWPRFHREIELEFASGCQMFVPHSGRTWGS
jgi:hypothetical protein